MKLFIIQAAIAAVLYVLVGAQNVDDDCVCYGSVTAYRNLLTHHAIQNKAVRRSLREVEAIREKREKVMRALQGSEDNCECVEVCDDDTPRDDDTTGKKGKGGSGKGSSGKKGEGKNDKGTPDGSRDDDMTSGKKGKGGSGKGSSGKKGKGSSGKGSSGKGGPGKGDTGRFEDDCVCECHQGECK
jgi:hypothetical protein